MRSCRKCWGVHLPTAVKNGACPGVAPSSSNLNTPWSLQSLLSRAVSRPEAGERLLVQAHPTTSELFQKLSAHSSPPAPPGLPVSFGSSASKQATNQPTGEHEATLCSANDHKWSRSHGAPVDPFSCYYFSTHKPDSQLPAPEYLCLQAFSDNWTPPCPSMQQAEIARELTPSRISL